MPEPIITPEEVRAARLDLGLTQQELADRLSVTNETVSRWEGGGAIAHPRMVRLALDRLLHQHAQRQQDAARCWQHRGRA